MEIPEGLSGVDNKTKILKLDKCLYGLKQSPRYWNEDISNFFRSIGFTELISETCVFIRKDKDGLALLVLYVDDITICTSTIKALNSIKRDLNHKYKMKDLGEIKKYLGLLINYNQSKGELTLSQPCYTQEMLDLYLDDKQKIYSFPMTDEYDKIINDPGSILLPEKNQFRNIMGKLIFLANLTRPDISYAVSRLCTKSANPSKRDLEEVQHLLAYVNGTKDLGIHVKMDKTDIPSCFVDASYARCYKTGKSQTGFCIKYGTGVIIWSSTLQTAVATSTTESEYIALHKASETVEWIRNMFKEIGNELKGPTLIHEDNVSAIKIAKQTTNKKRSRNYNTKYHKIRELLAANVIKVEHIDSKENIADLLTKPLTRIPHTYLRNKCGLNITTSK